LVRALVYQKGSHITLHNHETDKTPLVAPQYGACGLRCTFRPNPS
jgi:hypothetical protein